MMFCLNILSVLGLSVSLIIHIATFIWIIRPGKIILISLNALIGILLFSIFRISKKYRKRLGQNEMKDAFNRVAPQWLASTAAVIAIYGVTVFGLSLYGAFVEANATGQVQPSLNVFHRGLSGLFMAFYGMEFFMLYCIKQIHDELGY